MTRIGGIPESNSGLPNVNRLTPVTGSVPMLEIISPRRAAISPLTSESPDTEPMTLEPEHPEREIRRGRERQRHE